MKKRTSNRFGYAVALTLVVAATTVWGQGQDFSKVEIKVTKVGGNVYALEGSGGTIGVLAGPEGVFMVDSQFAPLTEKIVAAIKQITPSPIKLLVNTHLHGDHTGGNANFAQLGVILMGRDQLRARLATPNPPGKPAPPAALPVLTYDAPVTLHMNGEQVQLIPIRTAHTDGDTLIKFVNADVIFSGDFYRSLGYPNIDRANGGTFKGMVEGFNKLVELSGPATKIVPGHGAIVDRNAVTAHREMAEAISDEVLLMVQEGLTVEEVLAKKVTAKFDAKVPGAGTTGDRFVTQLYGELKGIPAR